MCSYLSLTSKGWRTTSDQHFDETHRDSPEFNRGKKVPHKKVLEHHNIETDIFLWYLDKLMRRGLNDLGHILITCQAAHGALEKVSALKSFGHVCRLNSAVIYEKSTIEQCHVSVGKGWYILEVTFQTPDERAHGKNSGLFVWCPARSELLMSLKMCRWNVINND